MDYNVTYRKKDKGLQCIISYKDSLGKWMQKSKQGFKTQKESKEWIDNVVSELEKTIKYVNPDMKDTTLDELFQTFIKHAKLYKGIGTMKTYDTAYISFKPLKDKKVAKIETSDIQECIDGMIRSGLAYSTMKTYIAKIKVVFKYAISPLKIIKEDPFVDVVMPPKPKDDIKIKALTESELNNLLSKIPNKRYYIISLIAATCGLRIGEILGLTWSDIDEKESIMNVNKQWNLVQEKPKIFGFSSVKSKNSNRKIPVPPKTLEALIKYKKDNPIDISGRVIAYKRTDSICVGLIYAYNKAGYSISVHDLRHTYASRLVANGVDFKTVAELMGDTVQVVIDTYSHFTSDMLTKAQQAINSIF